jgi:hypothetical protein
VRRTRVLAVDDLVEIGRVGNIGSLQSCLLALPAGSPGRGPQAWGYLRPLRSLCLQCGQ